MSRITKKSIKFTSIIYQKKYKIYKYNIPATIRQNKQFIIKIQWTSILVGRVLDIKESRFQRI